MDELFDGLDCRLRVSGLVADSIMMGIVNTAMEEAYKKVRSKEGDLERLNEKSRFCELAIMQLEWCLKFIQEEVDSYIDESSREREKLVSELIDARNQIQKRLEETELAIVEKDRELTERMENESRLRQALESKDEELKSLQISLKLERTKTERVREYVLSNQIRGDDDRDGSFYDLKKSLDAQFWIIRQKLDDERVHLADGMHQMKGSSSNMLKLDVIELKSELGLTGERNYEMDEMSSSVKSEEEQNGSCKGIKFYENSRSSEVDVSNCCMQTKAIERNMEFEQMAVDIDTLEETVEVGFEQMRDALSSLKVELMEQQWERSVEKETLVLVLRGFLRDVEENFKAKSLDGQINFPLGFTGENCASLIGDISSMRQELEKLLNIDNQLGIPPHPSSHVDIGDQGIPQKPMLLRCGKSDSSLMFKELQSLEDPPKEEMSRQAVHYVAEMIRNHESIIKRKRKEINWLKGENLRDKGRCIVKRGMEAKKMISEIISIFDRIIEGSSNQGISLNDYRWIYEDKPSPRRKILESEEAKEEKNAVHMMTVEGPDKLGNVLASNSIDMELKEGIRKLKQEREDLDIQTGIFKDTYKIVFKEFVNGASLEMDNNGIVSSIKEDLYTVYLREVVREWITEKENYYLETAIREEIHRINFSHVVEDINCFVNLQLVNYGEAWLQDTFPQDSSLANYFLQSSEIHKRNNLMHELDAFKALEGLMLSRNEVMDMDKQFDIGDWRLELGIESINYEEMLEDEDDAFSSVNSKLEKALQKTVMCKEQLKELSCSLDIVVGVREEANRQMAENEGILLDSPNGEKHCNALDSIVEPLKDFLRAITDFECMAYDKMKVHIVRLDVAKRKLDPLIHFVPPPREEEFLYKKAFVNRCYNLQTAEAEVDLLGDKVDALLCLLEKIYMALYHHSPILKDNFGIKDILKLIRKELNGEVVVTSPQFSWK